MIDSENEDADGDVDMTALGLQKKFRKWYTQLLKSLERKYSDTFDAIVKEIIKSEDPSISEARKKSLKTVLGFLFTVVCSDDNVNLFEKLYHHNSQYRVEAIKYLVKNLEKMSFSDDSKGLLQSSISERLSDDSPAVVSEALKFETKRLLKIVEPKQLREKLIAILERTMAEPSSWEAAGFAAMKHLTSNSLVFKANYTQTFISVLPFLLQSTTFDVSFIHQILNSHLAKFVPFIAALAEAVGDKYDKNEIFQIISEEFESKRGLPSVGEVILFIKQIPDEALTVSKAFYSMLLLGYAIEQNCQPEKSLEVLEIIKRFESLLKTVYVKSNAKWMTNVAMGQYPLNLNVGTIKNIIDRTDFKEIKKPSELNISANSSMSLLLLHKIFGLFVAGMAANQFSATKNELYVSGIHRIFEKVLLNMEWRMEFLTTYFIIDFLEPEQRAQINVDTKLQVFIISFFNQILQNASELKDISLSLSSFVRVVSALRSGSAEVREAAFDTLATIAHCKSNYAPLIAKLLKRRDEIVMDENQLSLILFTIHKESKDVKEIFDEFVEYLAAPEKDKLNKILLLEALTHVNTLDVIKSVTKLASGILKDSKGSHLTVLFRNLRL